LKINLYITNIKTKEIDIMYYLLLPLIYLFDGIDKIKNRICDVMEKITPAKNTIGDITFSAIQMIITIATAAFGVIRIIIESEFCFPSALLIFLTVVVFFINTVYTEYVRNWLRLISTNLLVYAVVVCVKTIRYMTYFVIPMIVLAVLTVIATLYIVYHRKRIFGSDDYSDSDDSHEYSDHFPEDYFTSQAPYNYCYESYYDDYSDDEPEEGSASGDNAEDIAAGEHIEDTADGVSEENTTDGDTDNVPVVDGSVSASPFEDGEDGEDVANDNPFEDAEATFKNIEDILALFSKNPVAENDGSDDDSDDDDSDDDDSDEIPLLSSMKKFERRSYKIGTIFTIIASVLLLFSVIMCSAGIGCYATRMSYMAWTVSRTEYEALEDRYREALADADEYYYYYILYTEAETDKIIHDFISGDTTENDAQFTASATDAEPEINIGNTAQLIPKNEKSPA